MNTFLSLITKQRPIDQACIDKINSMAAKSLAFKDMPYEDKNWVSEDGRIALFSWCNDTSHPQHTEQIVAQKNAAFTFSGNVFDYNLTTMYAVAERMFGNDDTKDQVRKLPGVFALCRAVANPPSIRVWNGFMPMETVFYSETPAYVVVGTRGLLVHLVAQQQETPSYALDNFGSFLTAGYFHDEHSPYQGLKIMPLYGELKLTLAGSEVHSLDGMGGFIGEGSGRQVNEIYDEMTEELLESVRALRTFGKPIELGLTGGKDSRLLAAAFEYTGVEIQTFSVGWENHPDVILGRKIAERLKLNHMSISPSVPNSTTLKTDPLARTCKAIYANDGMVNSWVAAPTEPKNVVKKLRVTGQGGEFYRGGWLKNPDVYKQVNTKGAKLFVLDKLSPHRRFLARSYIEPYEQFLIGLVKSYRHHLPMEALLERAFAMSYGLHWAPGTYRMYDSFMPRCDPMINNRLLRLCYELPL